jgi:hypothetical protein
MILGYLMYRSGLVPRGMAMLGLIGGPLVAASAIAIIFDVIERGSLVQGVATIPEALWELSFGVYLIVKGFKPSPLLAGADSGPVARGAGSWSAVAKRGPSRATRDGFGGSRDIGLLLIKAPRSLDLRPAARPG